MTTLLHILQHALGRGRRGQRKPGVAEDYRNHFCTGEGSKDWNICQEAVRAGLMTKHPPRSISGGDWIFVVTPNGVAYVDHHRTAQPKMSRSKARYAAWIEADSGLSFGEWLKCAT